jgi:hypothetical protein
VTPEEIMSMVVRQALREGSRRRLSRGEGAYTTLVVEALSKFENASVQLSEADRCSGVRRVALRHTSAMTAIDAATKALCAAIYHPHTDSLVVEDGAEILH